MHDLSWVDLAVASVLVLISVLISMRMRLGLTRKIGVAAVRTVVQLTAIGPIQQGHGAQQHTFAAARSPFHADFIAGVHGEIGRMQ